MNQNAGEVALTFACRDKRQLDEVRQDLAILIEEVNRIVDQSHVGLIFPHLRELRKKYSYLSKEKS